MALPVAKVFVEEALKAKDYRSNIEPTWCPGCGDFGVVAGLAKAYAGQMFNPSSVMTISGIGCSSRLPLWMNSYGVHSCHGRAIPVAVGAKIARPDLPVTVTIGDGDCWSIGGGHIPSAARKNIDLSVFVMDNNTYALTKNQTSPTSRQGLPGSLQPYGNIDEPMNVLEMIITMGATFVAQTYSGNPKHMSAVMEKALAHKGFAYINIISPCPTYNKVDTFQYYRPKQADINEAGHTELTNRAKALELAGQALNHIKDPEANVPIGIFYQVEKPTIHDKIKALQEKYKGDDNADLLKLLDQYRP